MGNQPLSVPVPLTSFGRWFPSPASALDDARAYKPALCTPLPIADLRHVVAVLADVMFVFHEFVLDGLFGVGGPRAQLRLIRSGSRTIVSSTNMNQPFVYQNDRDTPSHNHY